VAYDGVAYAEVDGPSRDMLVVQAGENEGIYMAPFDMSRIRAYRSVEAWGNSYRKPRVYGMLASTEVADPFVRPDARR
jgi:hypothetical protein